MGRSWSSYISPDSCQRNVEECLFFFGMSFVIGNEMIWISCLNEENQFIVFSDGYPDSKIAQIPTSIAHGVSALQGCHVKTSQTNKASQVGYRQSCWSNFQFSFPKLDLESEFRFVGPVESNPGLWKLTYSTKIIRRMCSTNVFRELLLLHLDCSVVASTSKSLNDFFFLLRQALVFQFVSCCVLWVDANTNAKPSSDGHTDAGANANADTSSGRYVLVPIFSC